MFTTFCKQIVNHARKTTLLRGVRPRLSGLKWSLKEAICAGIGALWHLKEAYLPYFDLTAETRTTGVLSKGAMPPNGSRYERALDVPLTLRRHGPPTRLDQRKMGAWGSYAGSAAGAAVLCAFPAGY
jgi:hypothetical protein